MAAPPHALNGASLARSSLLGVGMAPALAEPLVTAGKPIELAKDQVLVQRGDAADGLHLVLSGALGITSSNPSGDRFLVSVMPRGWLYGVISALDGGPAANDVEALVPTRLWHVSGAALRRALREAPELRESLQRLLAGRLRHSLEILDAQVHRNVRARIAARLLHLDARVAGAGAEVDLPQQVIAWFVGISRQRLNRELRAFARDGLVQLHYGRLRILDQTGLARLGGDAGEAGSSARRLPPRRP